MSRNHRVRQVINARVTVHTLLTLTSGFRVSKAALDNLLGLTSRELDPVRPGQRADGLLTRTIIDQLLDIARHRWTPGMRWDLGGRQSTTSLHPRPWNPT